MNAKEAQDGSKEAQDGPQMSPGKPLLAQDQCKEAQDGRKRLHEDHNWSKMDSETVNIALLLLPQHKMESLKSFEPLPKK